MQTFPPKYCHVVAARSFGDDAYVLLDTGPTGQPYLYGIACSRHEGGWREDGGANGPGWGQTDPDSHLGTLVACGEAPPGADQVRFEFEGTTAEEPVTEGAYLAAWWRVPCPEWDWPVLVGFRVAGRWTA